MLHHIINTIAGHKPKENTGLEQNDNAQDDLNNAQDGAKQKESKSFWAKEKKDNTQQKDTK